MQSTTAYVSALGVLAALVSGCTTSHSSASQVPTSPSAPAPGHSKTTPKPARSGADSATPKSSQATATTVPATPLSWTDVYAKAQSGVVRIEVATCTGGGTGSGFVLSPTLVVTAAHVVAGGKVVELIVGTTATAGRVVGIDEIADVALIEPAAALPGVALAFSSTPAKPADEVAAIGFPRGEAKTFVRGTVNALNHKDVIEGIPRHGLIEFDAAIDRGNSGGPLIDSRGDVVGMVDAGVVEVQGRRFAIPSATVEGLIQAWRAAPRPPAVHACDTLLGPDGSTLPTGTDPTKSLTQILATLRLYFDSIRRADAATALAQLLHAGSISDFQQAIDSSRDVDFQTHSIAPSAGNYVVWLSFTSTQDPGRGPAGRAAETCTRWSLDYTMTEHNHLWLIGSTAGHPGSAADRPCTTDEKQTALAAVGQ